MQIKYEVVVDKILTGLNEYNGFYSRDYFLDIEDRIQKLKKNIEYSTQEGRLLKIGIVGEVKAGKSSFLNALIFDGNDILPKASTPMTAALTKIAYAELPSAKIVFYSVKDWERIQELSNEYDREFDKYYSEYKKKYEEKQNQFSGRGINYSYIEPLKSKEEMKDKIKKKISLKLSSCKELTDMFNKSNKNLTDYLGKTIELKFENMKFELNNYIGVNGEFTSIVRHVELKMNNEMLKPVEIVDTPGLNDPIISRSETTKKFLTECDVVFLLSYCGQFLTKEDITFMSKTLPNEGIRNIIIIGSKFDSGILDDSNSKDIKTAYHSSKAIYDKQARENIAKCLSNSYNFETLLKIQDSLPPSYISSILFSCIQKKKQGIPYSKEENHIIEQLKKHFEDFNDDEKILLSLSGINDIKKKLSLIIKDKEKIISEKNKEILSDNKKILLNLLEDIMIQATQNKEDLKIYDKEQLENKLNLLENKLNSMRREIKNVFDDSSVEASEFLNDMKVDIDLEVENYIDFTIHTNYETKHEEFRRGFLGLFTEYRTYEITTHSAEVSDVLSNMRKYIARCKKKTNEEFKNIINLKKLENTIKNIIIGAFDLSQKDFNENDILTPLKTVIKKIKIPEIEIEEEEFGNFIIEKFSGGSVKGEDIHQLKLIENKLFTDIAKKIKEEIDNCEKKINNVMSEQAGIFVDNIIENLKTNIDMLKKQLKNKENAILKYDELCKLLVEYKKMIIEMEM
jgi:hypothetical protein